MLQFSKYQGTGNDFLLVDARTIGGDGDGVPAELSPAAVQHLCDRRFGVGGDGVILALPPLEDGEVRMRIFNADGSEPEMCGNGIRCLARFLADRDGEVPGRRWQVETLAGRIVPELRPDGRVRVDMGAPLLQPGEVPTTLPTGSAGLPQGELETEGRRWTVAAAGMGNPHLVIPVEAVEAIDLEALGPRLEHDPAFPARTNVHFVEVRGPAHLVMRVWERGAGPTLACGTGACATLVACHLLGLCGRQARIDLPGGPLEVAWDPDSGHLFLTGPAVAVFDGILRPEPAGSAGSSQGSVESPGEGPAEGAGEAPIDCSTACIEGCQRPDACPSREARERVQALLEQRSLDDLVALATRTVESRTRARFERDAGGAG